MERTGEMQMGKKNRVDDKSDVKKNI